MQTPAKLFVEALAPAERSGMSKSSSYVLEVLVEGSLDSADAPPPAPGLHAASHDQKQQ